MNDFETVSQITEAQREFAANALHNLPFAKLSGAKKRWGYGGKALREPASRILLTNAVRIPTGTHIVKKSLLLARSALKTSLPSRYEFPIGVTTADLRDAERLIDEIGSDFVMATK